MTGKPSSHRPPLPFAELRYSNCWEDAEVVCEALAPLEGARCLSIASAGDNSFSLLARGAASVLAVDVNPAQLALVELKAAALARLEHPALLAFLGVCPSATRCATYATLRSALSDAARGFWDARSSRIEAGIVHAGRLERYFTLFRRVVLPLVHSQRTVAALFEPRPAAERARFHAAVWNGWRWRLLFHAFFSRTLLGRLGRDPRLFREVRGAVAAPLLERTRQGLTELPTTDNPYLRYVLTGRFGPVLPDYLRPERQALLRGRLARLHLVQARVEDVLERLPPASLDAFNLSDVAEYLDRDAYHGLLEAVWRAAAPGARLAYWNLLVPRRRPSRMAARLVPRPQAAERLHAAARTFFYGAFVLEVAR